MSNRTPNNSDSVITGSTVGSGHRSRVKKGTKRASSSPLSSFLDSVNTVSVIQSVNIPEPIPQLVYQENSVEKSLTMGANVATLQPSLPMPTAAELVSSSNIIASNTINSNSSEPSAINSQNSPNQSIGHDISCIDLTGGDDEIEIITEKISVKPFKRRKRDNKPTSRPSQVNSCLPIQSLPSLPFIPFASTQPIYPPRSDSPIVDLANSPSPSTSSNSKSNVIDVLVESVPNQKNIPDTTGQETVRFKVVKCPICLEDDNKILAGGGEIVVTICGHVYCKSCIHQAIKTAHCCPQCRRKLNQRNYHRIFL
ncbi:putative protein TPRXL [Tetranychus urticae]|uniref:RING-type domain-containing protein n=1 Tax=Tetranychus urticae TaxID=32264 RepID=T1KRB5_TETUR|nr:putative protein TPRXL [Tetranychus urticae]